MLPVQAQRLADDPRAQRYHLRPVMVELNQGPVLVEDHETHVADYV